MDKVYEKKLEILSNLLETISQVKKQKSEFDLAFFIDNFVPHLAPVKRPDFHKEIISILQTGSINVRFPVQETDIRTRQLFQAPRGFAKSSIVSRFFPLWLAVYGKKKDIFLVSATISLAKENLRFLRQELETNEELIRAFGELKSDKWTEEQLNLSNGVIIRAKGRGFQIRGFRPDIIVCDDLEDEEVIYSKEQRDKLEHWFMRTLVPTLKPDQLLVYVGTKLHQFALIAKLEEKKEFDVKVYKAITDDKSIWEDMWPIEKLKNLREEIGTYAFEAEYQNNPISLAEQPIKFEFLSAKSEGEVVESCMAIDPAISEKESSDYRAITIMGRTDKGTFIEIYSEKGRWGLDEQIDKVIQLYARYKPHRVLLEEVAFQKVLRPLILQKARSKGIYMPLYRAELGVGNNKRPKDKMTRLMQVVHLYEQRLVEIRSQDLKEQLLAFPYGDYDDLVDTSVYCLYWLMRNNKGLVLAKKEERRLPIQTIDSFYVKEVRDGVFMAEQGVPPVPVFKTKIFKF